MHSWSTSGGSDVVTIIGIVLFVLTVAMITTFVCHTWRHRDIALSRCCTCSTRTKAILPKFLVVATSEQLPVASDCDQFRTHPDLTVNRSHEMDSCVKLTSSSSSAKNNNRKACTTSPSTVVCHAGTYPGSDSYYRLFRPSFCHRTEDLPDDGKLQHIYDSSRDLMSRNSRKVTPVMTFPFPDAVTTTEHAMIHRFSLEMHDLCRSNSLGYGGSISYC